MALYGNSKLPESPGRIIRQRAAAAIAIVGPSVFASSQKACLDAVYWLALSEKLGCRCTPLCVPPGVGRGSGARVVRRPSSTVNLFFVQSWLPSLLQELSSTVAEEADHAQGVPDAES